MNSSLSYSGAPDISRTGVLTALAKCLARNEYNDQLTLLALIDLHNFSQINQRFGYAIGDRILAELQERLTDVPNNPLCCRRVDGDKFALIISPLMNRQLVPLVAKKIFDQLSRVFFIDNQAAAIEGSIGFAAAGGPEGIVASAETMLQNAEAAAKKAHQAGQPYHLGEVSAPQQAHHQIALKQKIARALANNSFELFYQPQISLHNGRPCGAEALIRWNQHSYSVSPEQLVMLIEQSGRMEDFFYWTINTAVREAAQWSEHRISTAVNLSASCLQSPQLFDTIESSLNLWGADPALLCIEVTESTIQQDLNQGLQTLKRIKQLGVTIAIDDFGTGYSSLEYFKFIPADKLKIDKSFVLNMRNNQIDLDIVKLILDWGLRFQMETIAEGVEDAESLALLTQLGCTYAQGFLISKAMPASEFRQWLDSNPVTALSEPPS